MCGRYQFTAEQCEEIRQIAEAIQRKYGAGAWTPGEIRPVQPCPGPARTAPEGRSQADEVGIPAARHAGHQCPG